MCAESIESVALVFPGALGDFLLAMPALRALRPSHTGARVTIVVSQPLVGLAALAAVADEVASLDASASAWLFGASEQPRWLVGRPTVYSWLGATDAEMRARIGAVARGASFFTVERGDGPRHAAAAYARAVGAPASLATLRQRGRIEPPQSAAADRLYATLIPPVLAMHAGAGAPAKQWAVEGYRQVAGWWRATGGAVIEVSGPAEARRRVIPDAPVACDLALPDLAAVLARAAFYVGNDSGVSHLAGAVGATGVVLFGPTRPGRWRPLGGRLAPLEAAGAHRATGISLAALPATRVLAVCRRVMRAVARAPVDKGKPRY